MKSILLVDDEDLFRNRLSKAFIRRGLTTYEAANYEEAITMIKQHNPQLAVVDLKMPGRTGLDVIKDAKKIAPEIKMLVLTGYGSIATAIDAVKLGALAYIAKPADADDILVAFNKALGVEIPLQSDTIVAPSLARAEWEHINRVLADCDGNISHAAKRLGIHRRSLQRKLLKYPPKQ
jgi:two-component system response regulator RegA